VSDTSCTVSRGYVESAILTRCEHQRFGAESDAVWRPAVLTEPLETEYCTTDCPADKLIETLAPVHVGRGELGEIYDCGKNTTGYPVLRVSAPAGDEVEVIFSEELSVDGKLDMTHHHRQKFSVTSDGTERVVQPEFSWYGFRYFEVVGDAEPTTVKVVHAGVPVSSEFESDNETLNWIYKTFINTMLTNMHTGHPSDCPHIERRGYTGDGQLTCHAALTVLDAEAFYRKWLRDIADSQDALSGHIQYTAPYIRSGGGPGGWGSAIVEVPYQLYRHYGDARILEKYYGNMRRYIDYLEAHSEFSLVTSDEKGNWCLGDWCEPNVLYPEKGIRFHAQQVILPAAMVNTYFMVKSLQKMCEIAEVIGKEEDVAEYRQKISVRSRAIEAAYFNTFDGNFMSNVQGANAYGVDLGLGYEETYPNMKYYYEKLGNYDTGIFGTDILTRVLFERGDGELAVDLLLQDGAQGFERWRRNGATTFHEYWDSNDSRSHNHPMFGSPVAYFFEYLLGIRQKPHTAGYTDLVIAPQAVNKFGWMKGSMQVPCGTVSVDYRREDGKIHFTVRLPEGIEAVFSYGACEQALHAGENTIVV
jgi:alpha-L-rhamnosidase